MNNPNQVPSQRRFGGRSVAVVALFVVACIAATVVIWHFRGGNNHTREIVEPASADVDRENQRRAALPIDGARRQDSSLGRLRRDVTVEDDPLGEGWDSEAFDRAASKQLKRLAALLQADTDVSAHHVQSIVSSEFSCTPTRPLVLEEVFRDAALAVMRMPEATVRETEQSERLSDAGGLASALNTMRAPLRDAADRRASLKIIHVELHGDEVTSAVRVENCGFHPDGAIQQTAQWRCDWHWASHEQAPRLTALSVDDYEEVVSRGSSNTLFEDQTATVLGGVEAYHRQLLPGSNDWLARIEESLALQTFGHQGVAIGDVNGDGLEDIYVCQSAGLPNRLFVRDTQDALRDVSAAAGVDWLEPTNCALLLDLDNDGDQDLALSIDSDVMLLANDGGGNFARRALLPLSRPGTSLAAVDFDGDGDLDIYACVYYSGQSKPGELAHPVPFNDATNGGRNVLWRNDGADGSAWRFTDVTEAVGLEENNSRWSFAASWDDYDNDGDPDLYVANDFGRNNLYRNDDGRFSDRASLAGVEDGSFGMSVAWGDYNRDGLNDLYVSNMFSAAGNRVTYQRQFKHGDDEQVQSKYRYLARGNSLFENVGDGTFRDVSGRSGTMLARWAWGGRFADLNNDGWEDLLVANGWQTNAASDDL